jgi:ABC-type branched-subunit amino acid transport system ATPase component
VWVGEQWPAQGKIDAGAVAEAIAKTEPAAIFNVTFGADLAPRTVEQMIEAIREMKREGLSLFVSEQNIAFARLVAERVCVIKRGGIRFAGTMAEFDARPDVRAALSRVLRLLAAPRCL